VADRTAAGGARPHLRVAGTYRVGCRNGTRGRLRSPASVGAARAPAAGGLPGRAARSRLAAAARISAEFLGDLGGEH
jgi:hypothetical protein